MNGVLLVLILLVVAAIGIGGASYAGGDTVGTALALTSVTGLSQPVVVIGIVLTIGVLLWTGSYKLIERVLTVMVGLLGLLFIVTAVLVQPPIGDLLMGMFIPRLPPGTALLAVALIGTTVVPYNLFLHASLVQEKWGPGLDSRESLRAARTDTAPARSRGGPGRCVRGRRGRRWAQASFSVVSTGREPRRPSMRSRPEPSSPTRSSAAPPSGPSGSNGASSRWPA